MPEDGVEWIGHEKILSYEEIFFLVKILCDHGVKKIRFTGGEPLIRKGMVPFLEKVTISFPKLRIALTTNGSTLAEHARSLAGLGLASVNISLDTLDAEKFSGMTRGASLQHVLDGIDVLISHVSRAVTEIKMNAVLIRGFNDDDMIERLTAFAFEKGILLRFIEFMPLHSDLWSMEMFMPFSEALARLGGTSNWAEEKAEGISSAGPARYYVNSVTGQRIGVISAVTSHFCESCNRLRVTSTGEVRVCLFGSGQVSMTEAIRARDEKKVLELLLEAAAMKPESGATHHKAVRCEDTNMYKIGG